MVEQHGGSMVFQREGFPPGGGWIIRYGGKERAFLSGGRKFPGIDDLHERKFANPKTWDGYNRVLVDGAWEKLLRLLEEESG